MTEIQEGSKVARAEVVAGFAVSLAARADRLRELKPGWDSYDSKTPDSETLDRAVALALAVAPFFLDYEPALVPCSDGSVQVEWHTQGYDVEMWVARSDTADSGGLQDSDVAGALSSEDATRPTGEGT